LEKRVIKLAMKGFLNGRKLPKSLKARKKFAAQFVDYVGTMNQPDRDFIPFEQYATNTWEESEKTQSGADWQKDERNEMGFGVPRTAAARKKKAFEATKLAYFILGASATDEQLEEQARELMMLPMQSIKASQVRLQKDKAAKKKKKSKEEEANKAKEKSAKKGTKKRRRKTAEESLDELLIDDEAEDELGLEADEDDLDDMEDSDDDDMEAMDDMGEMDYEDEDDMEADEEDELDEDDLGDEELDIEIEEDEEDEGLEASAEDSDEDDISDEDDALLASLYTKKPKKSAKQGKKRTASKVKKLGRVTSGPQSGESEIEKLSGLWEGVRKVDFNNLDEIM